jgi:mono/diheme cytochrome c family protein
VLVLLAFVAAPVASADGKALYDAKCAMCHGKDGVAKPMAKGAGNFNDATWQKANSLETVIKDITDGKGKIMKGYKDRMSADDIKSVAEYVKSIK